jgi:hypothetical protein
MKYKGKVIKKAKYWLWNIYSISISNINLFKIASQKGKTTLRLFQVTIIYEARP